MFFLNRTYVADIKTLPTAVDYDEGDPEHTYSPPFNPFKQSERYLSHPQPPLTRPPFTLAADVFSFIGAAAAAEARSVASTVGGSSAPLRRTPAALNSSKYGPPWTGAPFHLRLNKQTHGGKQQF